MFTHTKPTLVRYNAIPNTYTIYIVVSFILCAFVVVVATFFFLMMTDDLYTTTPCISEWYVVCGSNIDLFICECLVALQTNAWNLICSIIVCMDGWYCLLGIYFFFISGVFVWLWLCSQHGNICMDSGALRWSAYISQSFRCGKNLYAIVQQRRKENFFHLNRWVDSIVVSFEGFVCVRNRIFIEGNHYSLLCLFCNLYIFIYDVQTTT